MRKNGIFNFSVFKCLTSSKIEVRLSMGMKRIDSKKYFLLYTYFEEFLALSVTRKLAEKWSDKSQKVEDIEIQEKSYEKLVSAFEAITGGAIPHTALDLTERDGMSFEEFEKKIEPFIGKKPPPKARKSRKPAANFAGSPPNPILSDATSSPENAQGIVDRYRNGWLAVFLSLSKPPGLATPDPKRDATMQRRYRKLEGFRFDRYVWPAIKWRRGEPAMSSYSDPYRDHRWITEDSEDKVASFMLKKLSENQLLVMHDDAGMGKSAFSWMLFDFIFRNTKNHSFVIRLEGIWPHKKSADGTTTHLTLLEVLTDELLGKRETGIPVQINKSFFEDQEEAIYRNAIPDILSKAQIYVLLDGLDQMGQADRDAATQALRASLRGEDGIPNCHWLVSGRPYVFRIADEPETLFNERVLRFKLAKFDKRRQQQYFDDIAKNPYFLNQPPSMRQPLDYLCSGWQAEATADDLGVPLHLAEIRKVIEAAMSDDGKALVQSEKLDVIHGSSDLHARVSEVYLRRAIEKTKTYDSDSISRPVGFSDQVHELRRICGVLAMQMMIDGNFNASIDITTSSLGSYKGVRQNKLVAVYLMRCRTRYEQSLKEEPSYWDWGVALLQKIEVTYRGDLDVFQDDCRSFRDRKTMEWYTAHFLANYSRDADWTDCVEGTGDRGEQWTRCWELAMELPVGFYSEEYLQKAIENVFSPPPVDRIAKRPFKWMWISWRTRLAQDRAAERSRIAKLKDAKTVIANFRSEFVELVEGGNETAKNLQFDFIRDSPDVTQEHPNQTENGWYRRIPDNGAFATFRGQRPDTVVVSQFWMRKFVVTNRVPPKYRQLRR